MIPGRCTQETETTMRSYAMKAETGLVMRGGETNGVGDGVGAAICVRKASKIEYLWVQQEVSPISAKEGQWLGQMVSIHL